METKEPKLEDYQLSVNSYEDFRNQKKDLEKLKSKYLYTTNDINIISAIIYIGCFYGFFIALTYQAFIISIVLFFIAFIYHNYDDNKDKEKRETEKREIDKINNKIELIRKQINPFEDACNKYYTNYLNSFFQEKLYKKRSGNEKFEESLQEFHQMIEEVNEINKKMIFWWISTHSHEAYLKERELNHTYQKGKKNIFNTFKDIKSYESEERKGYAANLIGETAKQKIQIIAPERKYNTVRKIDNWEIINKKRKETGDKGEEIVLAVEKEYLESIGRKDLSEKVYHISKEKGDGMGYDILSFFDNGEEKYIEVKSTTKAIETQFNISKNELEFLKINSRNALLYRVGVSTEPPEIEIKTGLQILESEIIPVTFIVKTKK